MSRYIPAPKLKTTEEAIDLIEFLSIAASLVRTQGFLSSKEAYQQGLEDSTANVAKDRYDKKDFSEVTDEDKKFAEKTIEIVKNLKDKNNAYKITIRGIADFGGIPENLIGYAASMIPFAQRHMDKEEAGPFLSEKNSVICHPVILKEKKDIFTKWGPSVLYTFKGKYDGAVIKWFCSGFQIQKKIGDEFFLGGRVKAHKEFEGLRYTLITRAKVIADI